MHLFYARFPMCVTSKRVLAQAGVERTQDALADWDLYIPRYGSTFSTEITDLLPSRTDQWIGGIPGTWRLSNKLSLWWGIEAAYGRERAIRLTPESWMLNDAKDADRFREQHSPQSHYILKNPILQRRTGLRICTTLEQSFEAHAEGYTLAQHLLPDLACVGGHRFNLRVYVLLVRRDGKLSVWLHRLGRCICAKAPMGDDLTDEAAVITRSVSSTALKPGLPFTLSQLLAQLNTVGLDTTQLMVRIEHCLSRTFFAATSRMNRSWHFADNPAFQLFGVDVVIGKSGAVWMVEANTGPDLKPLCAVDYKLKMTMVRDMFELCEMLPRTRDGGFRPLRAVFGDAAP